MKNLELSFRKRVTPNNPELIQDDVEVVSPSQEIEDNPDANHAQEGAEPCGTRDLTPAPLDSGVEGGTVDRPQRVRRPLHGLAILSLVVN